jgi:uncharacterized protein
MNEMPTETHAPPAAAPVSDRERLKLIDALRGVAVLGILLMNIPGFSMADYSTESFKSDPTNVNFWVSAVISVGFEGKIGRSSACSSAPAFCCSFQRKSRQDDR